jgi:excisionase family DNA binding protein
MRLDADTSPLMRPNDVARMLAVSRAWVYEAARTGRIPSIRIGGDDGPLRFMPEDIERWLDEQRAQWTPGIRSERRRSDEPAPRHHGGAGQTTPRRLRATPPNQPPLPGQQSLL